MRILFLQPQPCIRALKYAKGLRGALGKEVLMVFGYLKRTLTEFYGCGDELFDEFIKLDKGNLERDISRLVERYRPDIIHSHNAPDYLTVSAINSVEDTPVIHDTHDPITLRKTGYYEGDDEEKILEYSRQEKTANERSDGRIYVTEGVRDYIQQRYKVDPGRSLVFHNYVSEAMLPRQLTRKLSEEDGQTHIVYIGTITSRIEGHHYDLREIFREIAQRGLHIHIYAAREDDAYETLAEEDSFIHYHGHLDQELLLPEIAKYDFGWSGFNTAKNREHLDVVLPHKAIEYIACGLPVLTLPHKTLKRFVEEHQVGLAFDDLDEMKEKLKGGGYLRIRENVLKSRFKFTIESTIGELVGFYRKLIGNT